MFNLDDSELSVYIKEDLPYFDLTTYLQGDGDKIVNLEFFTRENLLLSCTEEAKRVAELLNCEVIKVKKSGSEIKKGESFLHVKGRYEDIHKTWRLSQILLEYACKISTYTNNMLKSIQEVNSTCQLLSTRKTFPFSKRLCIKAILVGGAYPHRLGLSESILFFPQHRSLYKDDSEFFATIKKIKSKSPEKKITIESSTFKDSKEAIKAGADVLQLDKINLKNTEKIVKYKNEKYPHIKVISAGGINIKNVKEYASLGIDGVVTSAMYVCGLANIGTRIKGF